MNIIPYVNRPAPLAWDVAKAIFGATGKALLWEPWDISTLFQNQAGTTPVTAGGDPVGLVLDKRLWGGKTLAQFEAAAPEILNDTGFDDPAAWTAYSPYAKIENSNLVVDGAPNAYRLLSQPGLGGRIVSGDLYKTTVEIVQSQTTSQQFQLRLHAGTTTSITPHGTPLGTYSAFVRAGGTSVAGDHNYFYNVTNVPPSSYQVGRASLKRIPGNHLSQSVLANSFTAARMPLTGRRNLLTRTEEFDNAAWIKTSCTVTDMGGGVFRLQAAAGSWVLRQSVATNGLNCTMGFDVKSNGAGLDDAQLIMSGIRTQPFSATSDWQRVNVTGLHNNNGTSNGIFPLAGKAVDILIRFPHLELGSVATPYQRVTNANDVHEDGVPDVWGIVSDYSGDVLPVTLPFAIDGEILIAGTGGTIIEPVSYASGSTFNLGTNTYTGGTPGILRAIGPIVGVVLLDRAFTDTEKAQLIDYYKDKGAKGLLVPGPEIGFAEGELNASDLIITAGQVTVDDLGDRLRLTRTSEAGSHTNVVVNSDPVVGGRVYLAKYSIVSVGASNNTYSSIRNGGATHFFVPLYSSLPVSVRGVNIATAAGSGTLQLAMAVSRGSNPSSSIEGDWMEIAKTFSVRELRPQEDWI